MRKHTKYASASGEDIRKRRRSTLIKLAVLLTFSLIVWIFSSIAWFTMNKDLEGAGAQMTSDDVEYELSVDNSIRSAPDTVTDYDTILSETFGYNTTALSTGGEVSSIKWVMVDESSSNGGLKPGSHGTLRFNVIPTNAGVLKLHFDLDLTGYYAQFADSNGSVDQSSIINGTLISLADIIENLEHENENANASTIAVNNQIIAKNQKAINLLNGHMLFYETKTTLTGTTDTNEYYSKRIDLDSGFTRTFNVTDAMVGAELPVVIYWIWPNTFSQIEYENGNANLIDPAMFSLNQPAYTLPDNSAVTPRTELLSHITSHPERFFDSTTISGKTAAELSTMLSLSNPDDIITLSNGYNNADQIIGETVKLLLVEIKSDKIE